MIDKIVAFIGRYLVWAILLAPVSFGIVWQQAQAANVNIDALPAAAGFNGIDLLECEQSGTNRKCTGAQTAAFTYLLMGGDATANTVGSVTFATVNGNVGSFGSATNCTTITVNAKGLITAASQTACTPAVGSITGLGAGVGTWLATPSSANLLAALTTKTGTGNAVFGTAPTIDSLNATTAMTLAFLTGGGTQCLTVSNTGVVGATACSGGGSVTTVTPGGGLVSGVTASCTQTNITVTGTLSEASCLNAQTGTTYTVLDSDRAKLVTLSNAAAIAVTLPQAGAASAFANGWRSTFTNKGAGTATFMPTTSTINGAATYPLFSGQSITIVSDGTNYQIDPGTSGGIAAATQAGANYAFLGSDFGKLINLNNGSNQIPTLPVATTFGPGWFVQACNQGAGTQTITPTTSLIGGAATFVLPAGTIGAPKCAGIVSDGANYMVVTDFPAGGSGTSALGTGAITSATCATAVTTAATGITTTDVVRWGFNGDPTAVTGYAPVTSGALTIFAYPTANNVNFKVCNLTTGSITPGAITLNWQWGR